MQASINSLERENEKLETQITQNNQSLQSYASQLDFYRERVFELQNDLQGVLWASKDLPLSRGLQFSRKSRLNRPVLLSGNRFLKKVPLSISRLKSRPGKGRVLVQTTPLMGVVFQDAANTAVFVARE